MLGPVAEPIAAGCWWVLIPGSAPLGRFYGPDAKKNARLFRDAMNSRLDRYRAALERIRQWDCLNPPQPELLGDLPWLKRLVDEALAD